MCTPICGDAKVVGTEICDDGNIADGIGCKPDCTGAILGYSCTAGSLTSPSVCAWACGDSILEAGEICDDGN